MGEEEKYVQVTVYARMGEAFSDGSGYWLDVHGIDLAVRNEQVQRVIPLNTLSEKAQRILYMLYEMRGRYIAGWTLGELLGGNAASIQAAHVLHGSELIQNEYERALSELVQAGLVEQMPKLGERWRLVVKPQPDVNTPCV